MISPEWDGYVYNDPNSFLDCGHWHGKIVQDGQTGFTTVLSMPFRASDQASAMGFQRTESFLIG
jgi:hypothetical protein